MNSRLIFGMLVFIVLCSSFSGAQKTIYLTRSGKVTFSSDAPLELIQAQSKVLRGAIDVDRRTFAFTMDIKSFEGFNSPLQKVHFNENYLESNLYRKASFSGKLIENVDLSQKGEYVVRAKGQLVMHGISRERIIKSTVINDGNKLIVDSYFTIFLADHDITIPKIVYQKIAEEIEIKVYSEMTQQ